MVNLDVGPTLHYQHIILPEASLIFHVPLTNGVVDYAWFEITLIKRSMAYYFSIF